MMPLAVPGVLIKGVGVVNKKEKASRLHGDVAPLIWVPCCRNKTEGVVA